MFQPKIVPYYPEEKGTKFVCGDYVLELQTVKDKTLWIERLIHVTHTTVRFIREKHLPMAVKQFDPSFTVMGGVSHGTVVYRFLFIWIWQFVLKCSYWQLFITNVKET